mmetsp:Transcript_4044/g.5624  ORF Transcript_4044/g.5624 Transcript_4044/m.5624 type:complete len:396 (+) Transcript_4044:110-1297(+)|eukprot:CAMPEP_0117752896 /NCGR_PEP_ID=MMETSP0947-20121206/11897_1 /TAXON_ID=44440 /ORGANISM="Chattonella subsalsa, Strain CCMP2191" /LENGTH=395 /DNA_ID=CAMNT_0005571663 /DNA_START=110 /DNA_END=1297 /DNA_ORIENTATION=-
MEFVSHPNGNPHTSNKDHSVPETRGTEEGSAKRNIIRRHEKGGEKRQGGPGKGNWVVTDDGSSETGKAPLDPADPNYDSEEETEDVIYVSNGDGTSPKITNRPEDIGPMLSLSEYKRRIIVTLEEYFLSEDLDEVERSVVELESPEYNYELVKRAINLSLDKRDHERELVSRMLSALYPKVLKSNDVAKGFERLFEMIDDIQLDAPSAKNVVAAFLARGVVDEILPPAFLSDRLVVSMGGEVVEHAKLLLSLEHHGARLERIWGPGDGRPVEELKVAVDQLLEEYILSRQVEEAEKCVKELDSPFFTHEIVKRAVKLSLDKKEEDQVAISELLVHLHANEVISLQQIKKGFDRIHEVIVDLTLDTPNARDLISKFEERGKGAGILPADYMGGSST